MLERDSRLDLSPIENLMLWPSDSMAEMRQQAFAVAAYELTDWADDPIVLDKETFRFIRTLPPLSDIQERARLPFLHGVVAGRRLWTLMCKLQVNPRTSFSQIDPLITVRSSKKYRVGTDSIEKTIWPKYKTVAHLWSAFVILSLRDGSPNPFPCRRNELGIFLSLAEAVRRIGSAQSIYNKSRPIISGAVSIAPAGLREAEITWPIKDNPNPVITIAMSGGRQIVLSCI